MSKKMMLLALSVAAAALFALPAVASATPAHIDVAKDFTISNKTFEDENKEITNIPAILEDVNGNRVTCSQGATGSGSFENTTTGTIKLVFHGCSASGFNCNSPGEPAGTIATTVLPFHLIMIANHSPGVLITPTTDPKTGVKHFATFNCTIFVKKEVRGNGVIGTITSPTCGTASTTATLAFEQSTAEGGTGLQKHTTYTGVDYHLTSNGTKAAQIGEGQIHFENPRTITCTPVA